MSAVARPRPPNPQPHRAPSANVDRFVRRAAGIAALALLLALAGCARPVGDFGRAAPDPLHDEVMPLLGTGRALLSKEPVSAFNLADQEREMRDRIWRYLIAPHAYDWFGANIAEFQRTRILPVSAKPMRTDLYYQWLHSERFASSRVRYARIADNVTTDIQMMPSAFASICAVREIDRQRGVADNGLADLDEKTKGDAAARQFENETQIAWFVRAVGNRSQSYSFALDHLLVETPHEEAVKVNGLLSDLEIYVEAAERGDFCSDLSLGRGSAAPAIRSRILRSDVLVKGS